MRIGIGDAVVMKYCGEFELFKLLASLNYTRRTDHYLSIYLSMIVIKLAIEAIRRKIMHLHCLRTV